MLLAAMTAEQLSVDCAYMSRAQVIALLLPDAERNGSASGPDPVAVMLLRDREGRMALEHVRTDSTLGRFAMATGCFRPGKPIIDPLSREVIGYEMEMVATPAVPMR